MSDLRSGIATSCSLFHVARGTLSWLSAGRKRTEVDPRNTARWCLSSELLRFWQTRQTISANPWANVKGPSIAKALAPLTR